MPMEIDAIKGGKKGKGKGQGKGQKGSHKGREARGDTSSHPPLGEPPTKGGTAAPTAPRYAEGLLGQGPGQGCGRSW